jgi:glycosyltransferase involved in cell wall biosynthesis
MASNMVVIGTTTGGTSEILSDGITGLTFPAGDADALSRQIQQLLREPGLAGRLAVAGRQRVLSYFNLERMVNEIEAYLQEVVEGLPPDHEALPNQSYA